MTDEEMLKLDMICGVRFAPTFYVPLKGESTLTPEQKETLRKEKLKEKIRDITFDVLCISGLVCCVLGVINLIFDVAAVIHCFILWRLSNKM